MKLLTESHRAWLIHVCTCLQDASRALPRLDYIGLSDPSFAKEDAVNRPFISALQAHHSYVFPEGSPSALPRSSETSEHHRLVIWLSWPVGSM